MFLVYLPSLSDACVSNLYANNVFMVVVYRSVLLYKLIKVGFFWHQLNLHKSNKVYPVQPKPNSPLLRSWLLRGRFKTKKTIKIQSGESQVVVNIPFVGPLSVDVALCAPITEQWYFYIRYSLISWHLSNFYDKT